MIIKKMTASFGCLENETLELADGLNIITTPNEGGKSSWCAFIRAMLYGVNSSQRAKAGVKPDKVKFAPWSGAPMAGTMDIEQGGDAITLTRSTRLAGSPMKEFSAVYTGTATAVPGLTAADAGDVLTGMPRGVFESSVFIRQAGMAVVNSPELEARINSIVSDGEDESYTQADNSLRAWLRLRKFNKSGAIPALEAEISALGRQLDSTEAGSEYRAALEKRIEQAELALAEQQRLSAENARARGRARLENLGSAREKAAESKATRDRAAVELEALEKEIGRSIFQGRPIEEVKANADSELAEYERRKKSLLPKWLILLLLLAGVGVCLGSLNYDIGWLLVPGALLMGGAVACAMIFRFRNNHYIGWGKMLEGKYGSSEKSEILALLQLYEVKTSDLEAKKSELGHLESACAAAERALSAAEQSLVSDGPGEDGELLSARAELESLRRSLSAAEGKLEAMGDPIALGAELREKQERLGQLREQYEDISLAIAALAEANEELQLRFSPRLGQRAAEYMSELTGGKYEHLSFDRKLSATAGRVGDSLEREMDYLSAGTADQLYLALRLAITELALPEGCDCPLILDDALVNFDDERMGFALEVLKKIAEKRQVILFSCQKREKEYLLLHKN